MAKIVQEYYFDDLSINQNDEPLVPASRTIQFMLEGEYREIDLSDDNIKELEDALSPYIVASREMAKPKRSYRKKQPAFEENAGTQDS